MKLKILEQKPSYIQVGVESSDGEFFGKVNITTWTLSRMNAKPEREEELKLSFDCFPTDKREVDFEISKMTPLKKGDI